MDSLVYWIWLSLACIPGSRAFADLMKKFSNAYEVYDATDRQIRSAINPNISDCSALYNKDLERAEEIYKFCTEKGVGIVTFNDENYPKLLKRIDNPPVLLYYRGTIPDWDDKYRCAVVGTRRLSSYGRKVAYNIAYDLAKLDVVIVSGMAKGIDGVAHAAALEAGGTTVAVLGSGIDVCYPTEHLTLARAIVKQGCIFTEYPPGTPPTKRNFPVRNRLISGLCDATVVAEADMDSGALLTANRAIEQKRQLFAVPTAIDCEIPSGTNYLIKSGARVCSLSTDIVQDLFSLAHSGIRFTDVLEEKPQTNFMEVLAKYRVVSNTPDDPVYLPFSAKPKPTDVFLPPKTKAELKKVDEMRNQPQEPFKPIDPRQETKFFETGFMGFTKEELKLYKKIPFEGDCSIESLLSDGMEMKDLMRHILRLEMPCFIEVLPGDRVRRRCLKSSKS